MPNDIERREPDQGPPSDAEVIAAENELIDAARPFFEKALRFGDLLNRKKLALPHGEFLGWLEATCKMSPRSAQEWMRVARHRPELEAANTRLPAHLTVTDALTLLAAPQDEEPPTTDNGSQDEQPPTTVNGSEPAAVLDERGEPVTEERFQRIFAHSARFGSIMSALANLKTEIKELDEMPAGEVLHEQIQSIERDRRNMYAAVKFAKPWAVCPYCGGSASHSQCGGCKGRGWVTKEVFDQSRKVGSSE